MTEKLYHQDAFLQDFTAQVLEGREGPEGRFLRLDRTCFYPEGGGQPGDSGLLQAGEGILKVDDTQINSQGQIWHRVSSGGKLPDVGSQVRGQIDWHRRYDHMQQHSGEHLIAACLHQLVGGFTHGLHIGREVSTIDVSLPSKSLRLTQEQLDQIEALAAERVTADLSISCSFPNPDDIGGLPLRKDPTVKEDVRICAMGDFEMVACGGTHLGRTSQIGLVKLLQSQPARGKLRLSFLCGQRAMAHYARCYAALSKAATLLSAQVDDLPGKVQALQAEAAALRQQVHSLGKEKALLLADQLLKNAKGLQDGGRLVLGQLDQASAPHLQDLAQHLLQGQNLLLLLAAQEAGQARFLFARSADRAEDLAALLQKLQVKGGGKPDFVRGAAPMGAADLLDLASRHFL